MLLEVSGIQVPLKEFEPGKVPNLKPYAAKVLGLSDKEIIQASLKRKSVDARKSGVKFICSVIVEVSDNANREDFKKSKGVTIKPYAPPEPLFIPIVDNSENEPSSNSDFAIAATQEPNRPIVVGAGPAGLFCALYLAKAGMRPILLERGASVDERVAAVQAFNDGAPLNLATNVQFGEGGAGTFSDGKLNTGTKSPWSRQVLEWFVEAGAPVQILTDAKPHIGTDYLRTVVKNLREIIIQAGGEVLFNRQLTNLQFGEDGKVCAVEVTENRWPASPAREFETDSASKYGHECAARTIPCNTVVLACGHSARDTFRMLQQAGITMEPKAFSVGVRIEHLQSAIDLAQYGKDAGHPSLEPADYKLVAHLPSGRSVYSFCMCPGGTVVAAASEEFGVVTNGMSTFARDSKNANSALLVSVTPADFPSEDPLAGTIFQRRIEQAAYGEALEMDAEAQPWAAPAQTVGDFLADRAGNASKEVKPTYPRGVVWCDLREIFPEFVTDSLAEALPILGRKLKGFDNPEAVMTGVETRSSSPVRILRHKETLQAMGNDGNIPDIGLFPCGEGPGYAGGIMSAATDGLEVACRIVEDAALPIVMDALKSGSPAIFPTDTVYGLGVAVNYCESPAVLYELKHRESSKPIPWLVGSAEDLKRFGTDLPEEAIIFAQDNWPGPYTLVVKASAEVPKAYQSAEGTIALRMPRHPLTLRIIKELGSPIATTSANLSGEPPTATATDLAPQLLAEVASILEPNPSTSVGESTPSEIIDFTTGIPRRLR